MASGDSLRLIVHGMRFITSVIGIPMYSDPVDAAGREIDAWCHSSANN
jgi:hypothetical protein